ncbi:helix-turn-helix domain-containing protein [candidate division CSSED10-310 bacterium]|uniref:Helix-turn-helix domain-containing protein n=1 Tax=candidate division CSSED10-310 bacterium TaxID=2855610 RepID=A0ABV6Z563_UNCC1
MFYYAKISKEDDSYLVSFPEFENINTYGCTIDEALKNAEEALNGSIESDFERGFLIPIPSDQTGDYYYRIYLRPHIEIALRLKQLRSQKTQIEIAKELGVSYQAYQKLENPRKCNPTIKTLEKIAKIYKKQIEIAIK